MKMKKRMYLVVAGYFRFFAGLVLRRWRPRVIAITGSAGKTTMLHLVEFQLGEVAHYSHNANSAYGVAFDILGLEGVRGSKWRWVYLFVMAPVRAVVARRGGDVGRDACDKTGKEFYREGRPEFYVVEIDGERPKEAEWLAKWLRPEVTLWVSVGLSHAVQFDAVVREGEFGSLEEAISHEFASLARWAGKLVLIDGESELMRRSVAGIEAEVGEVRLAEVKKYRVEPFGTEFVVGSGKGKKIFRFDHAEPREIGLQILMMMRLMEYLGREVGSDLAGLVMPPGRSGVFWGERGVILVDSTYNAHVISMQSMLLMMKEMKTEKRKWLVIGDMVEQGSIEAEEHRKLGELIAEVGADFVMLVGRRVGKWTAEVLRERGQEFVVVGEVREGLLKLRERMTGEEVILFKGSQYLEWMVGKLLANREEMRRLPRREVAAVRRRMRRGLDE